MKRYILMVAVLTVGLTALPTAYAQFNVDFGDPETGANVLIPDDVTITVGETVSFLVHGNHQVTIYRVDDATTRPDVEADIIPGEDYVITDAVEVPIVDTINRDFEHPAIIHDHSTSTPSLVAHSWLDVDAGTIDRDTALNVQVNFLVPGRYLVICGRKTHLDQSMFGFVWVLPVPEG